MTMLADLPRDFRYAVRSLLRTPGFTVVAVAVLALGIGATSAIFSLVSAMWLKPLPFADVERVVTIWIDGSAGGGPARGELTPAYYADWHQSAQSLEEMAPVVPATVNLTGDGEPEQLIGVRSTPNLFATIGLAPIVGRTFLPEDGASEAVVVTEGFWRRRLGGDPAAVGRTITLDGSPHEVVGVVPRDFRFPNVPFSEKDVFIATVFSPDVLAQRGASTGRSSRSCAPGCPSVRRRRSCAQSAPRSTRRRRTRSAIPRCSCRCARRLRAASARATATSVPRSSRCSAPWRSCCSSRAPTSRT
jgi:hypothetical protein